MSKCPLCRGRKVALGGTCPLCMGAGQVVDIDEACDDLAEVLTEDTHRRLDDIEVAVHRARAGLPPRRP